MGHFVLEKRGGKTEFNLHQVFNKIQTWCDICLVNTLLECLNLRKVNRHIKLLCAWFEEWLIKWIIELSKLDQGTQEHTEVYAMLCGSTMYALTIKNNLSLNLA